MYSKSFNLANPTFGKYNQNMTGSDYISLKKLKLFETASCYAEWEND